jgi:predicted RNA-binding Zn-ribbon protein involved in translation (DUF1610 family)
MASLVQRLVTRLMPGRAAEIERESRQWDVACPRCGDTRSVWDLGGIRYKAASKGKRIGTTCPECGERGLFDVVRRSQ